MEITEIKPRAKSKKVLCENCKCARYSKCYCMRKGTVPPAAVILPMYK